MAMSNWRGAKGHPFFENAVGNEEFSRVAGEFQFHPDGGGPEGVRIRITENLRGTFDVTMSHHPHCPGTSGQYGAGGASQGHPSLEEALESILRGYSAHCTGSKVEDIEWKRNPHF